MALLYDPYYWSTFLEIFQDICVPYNAKRLEFSWNFLSEEFTELCPPYNALPLDYFEFRYGFKGGSFPFTYSRHIEGLCNNPEYPLYQTSMAFDVSGPQCKSCLDDRCERRNDCKVWATGWKTGTIDLFPTDQKHVIEIILKDYAPYGFTKYKSALLIDDVKIITE